MQRELVCADCSRLLLSWLKTRRRASARSWPWTIGGDGARGVKGSVETGEYVSTGCVERFSGVKAGPGEDQWPCRSGARRLFNTLAVLLVRAHFRDGGARNDAQRVLVGGRARAAPREAIFNNCGRSPPPSAGAFWRW